MNIQFTKLSKIV